MTTLADVLRDKIIAALEAVTIRIPIEYQTLCELADDMVELAIDEQPLLEKMNATKQEMADV